MLILLIIIIIGLFILDSNHMKEQFTNLQYFIVKYVSDPIKLTKYKKMYPNNIVQSNTVKSLNTNQIKIQSNIKSIYAPKIKEKFKVKIDPIVSNIKYNLYGEDNLNFKKAGIVNSTNNIDQTTNINIMNHTNKTQGKTIKDLYDEITNDNRFDLQQDMNNVNAFDSHDNYIIDKQYGATHFDTYSIKN